MFEQVSQQKLNEIDSSLITIRDVSIEDIPHVLKYWYHSPTGFIESIGVDRQKMPTEQEMEKFLYYKSSTNALLKESKINALTILYKNRAIGFHSLNPLFENDFGIFHAHIWDPSMRRCGIGVYSYQLACELFFQRFNLKRILFKTPIQNIGAIRVKEKLGIRCIGEEVIEFGIIKANTQAKVFEILRDEKLKLTP